MKGSGPAFGWKLDFCPLRRLSGGKTSRSINPLFLPDRLVFTVYLKLSKSEIRRSLTKTPIPDRTLISINASLLRGLPRNFSQHLSIRGEFFQKRQQAL